MLLNRKIGALKTSISKSTVDERFREFVCSVTLLAVILLQIAIATAGRERKSWEVNLFVSLLGCLSVCVSSLGEISLLAKF